MIISQVREKGRGRPAKDHYHHLDTAKELAMVERNEKVRYDATSLNARNV